MNCKVVAITKPLIEENLSVEEFVAYCARVSNPSNQNNKLTSRKLLQYCAKNKHWSIFEMVHIVMEVNTTRDIGRQILRHRSFSFQEFSQRYADPTQLGFVVREARLQDSKNRQNSVEIDNEALQQEWLHTQVRLLDEVRASYKWAIDNGIAKEQARSVLPEGLTSSRLYMAGSLRSWIHYCQLRMANGTQKEHRLIAEECWSNILQYFPSLEDVLMVEDH